MTVRGGSPAFWTRPHSGDNSVDTCAWAQEERCVQPMENRWMTPSWMWVTTGFSSRPCGRTKLIHSRPEMCTAAVHPSYTRASWAPPATTGFVHTIHRPYYNDETWIDVISLRVPGDRTTETPGLWRRLGLGTEPQNAMTCVASGRSAIGSGLTSRSHSAGRTAGYRVEPASDGEVRCHLHMYQHKHLDMFGEGR